MKLTILLLTTVLFLGYSTQSQAHCQSSLFQTFNQEVLKHQFDSLSTPELTQHNHFSKDISKTPREIFSRHYHLIQKAKKQVLLQTWRFDTNSLGAAYLKKALSDLSEKRKKEGAKTPVGIWLLINTTALQGHQHAKEKILQFIKENNLNTSFVRIYLGFFRSRGVGANHAKNLIIDNKLALITGANHSYNFNSKNYLFDSAITMKGDVVHTLNRDFIEVWQSRHGNKHIPKLLNKRSSDSCQPALFVRQKTNSKLTSKPQSSSSNWGFIHAMGVAKKRIDIFTPNLNANTFQQAIINALNRGVEVRVILSHRYIATLQDLPTRGGANTKQVSALFKAIKKQSPQMDICRLLKIKWYSEDGISKKSGSKGNAHVKYMSVDGQISYFGSANMDNQSLVNSREIGLFIDSRTRARQWREQLFDPEFTKGIDVQECGGPEELQ